MDSREEEEESASNVIMQRAGGSGGDDGGVGGGGGDGGGDDGGGGGGGDGSYFIVCLCCRCVQLFVNINVCACVRRNKLSQHRFNSVEFDDYKMGCNYHWKSLLQLPPDATRCCQLIRHSHEKRKNRVNKRKEMSTEMTLTTTCYLFNYTTPGGLGKKGFKARGSDGGVRGAGGDF